MRPKEDQDGILLRLGMEELEMMVDLRPFMQRNPFVVQVPAVCFAILDVSVTAGVEHVLI